MSEQLLIDAEHLAKLFKDGGWSELRVTSGAVNLLLSKDANANLDGDNGVTFDVAVAPKSSVAEGPQTPKRKLPEPSASTPETISVNPDWYAVVAPNIGTFYRSPKPGAAPFVEVGQHVTAQTEICLLEVMKLFTSVNAGIDGTIIEICGADAELVEGGQLLFYIQPD